jgi:hypothetical protein
VVRVLASDASGVSSLSLKAAGIVLAADARTCDYTRAQPCPASVDDTFTVDTAQIPDGTHQLQASATDAAGQTGVSTATLRVDQHAPGAPVGLKAERAADGTYSVTWSSPAQGTASPVVRAHYRVCDALGVACTTGVVAGTERIDGLVVPSGSQVGVWLEDEAGNADVGSAAVVDPDSNAGPGPRVIGTNPPVLLPSGPADPPRLRISRARRAGSVLTLSGTVARAASARVTAQLARTRSGKVLATAKVRPRNGKWTARVKLPSALRRSTTLYLKLNFAGEASFKKSALRRRLARKAPRPGTSAVEFSLESR